MTKNNKGELQKIKVKVIKKFQWDLLCPSSDRPNSTKFDITLPSILFRNIYPTLSMPASGRDATPDATDVMCEANLVRVKTVQC